FAARPGRSQRGAGCIWIHCGAKVMNDTELDELLDTWKTPAAPPSMREYVRAGMLAGSTTRPKPSLRDLLRGWRLVFASAAVILLAVLVDISAFSQKASPPPYTVDSEVTLY